MRGGRRGRLLSSGRKTLRVLVLLALCPACVGLGVASCFGFAVSVGLRAAGGAVVSECVELLFPAGGGFVELAGFGVGSHCECLSVGGFLPAPNSIPPPPPVSSREGVTPTPTA